MNNDRPVLVIGGSGQIGQLLVKLLREMGRSVVATYHRNERHALVHLDASCPQQVSDLFAQVKPAMVVNALNAPGGTDVCELEPTLAERAHFSTGRNLADESRKYGVKLIHISTDYVFDGQAGPYRETDRARPLSQLGLAKFKLEEYIRRALPDSLIVRTSFVFSWTPESKTKNFAMQVLDSYRAGQLMKAPIDQIGNVTYAPNFCEALLEMAQLDLTGLYHLAGTTRCSKYDWALRIIAHFGLDPTLIQGVTTTELRQPGPRPLQSGFVLVKATAALQRARLMSLEEGLEEMRNQMTEAGVRL